MPAPSELKAVFPVLAVGFIGLALVMTRKKKETGVRIYCGTTIIYLFSFVSLVHFVVDPF